MLQIPSFVFSPPFSLPGFRHLLRNLKIPALLCWHRCHLPAPTAEDSVQLCERGPHMTNIYTCLSPTRVLHTQAPHVSSTRACAPHAPMYRPSCTRAFPSMAMAAACGPGPHTCSHVLIVRRRVFSAAEAAGGEGEPRRPHRRNERAGRPPICCYGGSPCTHCTALGLFHLLARDRLLLEKIEKFAHNSRLSNILCISAGKAHYLLVRVRFRKNWLG